MSNNTSHSNSRKYNGTSSASQRFQSSNNDHHTKKPLDQKKLSKTETKYIDWNSNVNSRLETIMKLYNVNNLADVSKTGVSVQQTSEPEIKSVFVNPPKRVLPSIPHSNNGSWKYYRPVTAPANLTIPSTTPHAKKVLSISNPPKRVVATPTLIPSAPTPVLAASPSLDSIVSSSSRPESAKSFRANADLVSCLKTKVTNVKVKSKMMTTPSKQSVTFAPDTVNVEREQKPRKLKTPKNNRKPRFAHPAQGHFLPPGSELVPFSGPEGPCKDNPYTRFTTVWKHPNDRTSKETNIKWKLRSQRFRKLLSEISDIHAIFHRLADRQRIKTLVRELIPRYLLCIDISLMDGDLMHAEKLVTTISTMIRVLQIELHDNFFESDGGIKELPPIPTESVDYFEQLSVVIFALNRISGDRSRSETDFLSIEPVFAKLQLELLCLVIAPVNTVMFRCLVAVIPHSAIRALHLLDLAKEAGNPTFFIKWINNSVMHRDYMSAMKEFGLVDEIGAKDVVPPLCKWVEPLQLTFHNRPMTVDTASLISDSHQSHYN